jgi:hypothetical protein
VYVFCDGTLDWASAHDACLLRGMQLVRIDSAAENDWVRTLAYADFAEKRITSADWRWLGASDENADGDWHWSDGDLFWQGGRGGTAVGGAFTLWAATSPRGNTLDARCAAIQGDANPNWEDVARSQLRSFVCEAY